MSQIEELVAAVERGGYDAAPTELVQGTSAWRRPDGTFFWYLPKPFVHDGELDAVESPEEAVDLRAQRKRDGVCPECGHRGEWRMLALFCPEHGRFAG